MSGTVESLTTDWRGDTLAADVAAVDTVLAVGDTSDFDEDADSANRWLVIADSAPLEYVAVDHDADTVTLAGTAGAAFEAGDPVVVWDASVLPDGAKVVEYVAAVTTDRGPVDAVVPHEKIPLAGVDSLIGASVTLAEDDSGWYVDQVLGREPVFDQAVIDTPFMDLYRTADTSWPDSSGAFTRFDGWLIETRSGMSVLSGVITPDQLGLYLMVLTVRWAGNSSGRRVVRLMSTIGGVDTQIAGIPASPPDADPFTQQVVAVHRVVEGETFQAEARQTSGAGLDVIGTGTTLQIVRLQA